MGHPLIEEFCRVSGAFSPEFLRRCQRVFREEVQPQLDEREHLLIENADLKAQVEKLTAKAKSKAGAQ
ncbi:MAG: hypothetical protein AB7Q29_19575 [Vicinamibacterales bacterium]